MKTLVYLTLFLNLLTTLHASDGTNNPCFRVPLIQVNQLPGQLWTVADNQKSKGLVIVGHGMNLRPDKMDDIAQEFVKRHYTVYRLELPGHYRGADKDISAKKFYDHFRSSYCSLVKSFAGPIIMVGQSTAALVAAGFHHQAFHKQIYLSPALYPKWFAKITRIIPGWFPIPSLMPVSYRVHSYINGSFYHTILDSVDRWKEKSLGSPTLIFLHPQDELIDVKKTMAFCQKDPMAVALVL